MFPDSGIVAPRVFHRILIAVLLLACASTLLATTTASADELKQRGRATPYSGKVKQVNPDGSVAIEVTDFGEIAVSKSDIEWVKVDRPRELEGLLAAVAAAQYATAVHGLKPLVEHLLGLPEETDSWIADAALQLGECYIGLKDWSAASNLFERIKEMYPSESTTARRAELGRARILSARQQADAALAIIARLVEPATKSLIVSPEESRLFARAYLVRGDCLSGKRQWKGALTSYLTVAVLYYHDKTLLNEARYKAGQMCERLAEWAHATEIYGELLADSPPQAAYRDDVTRRLTEAQEKSKQVANP
jgi:tetratricopeptide (TPR) repeat protein